MIAAGIEYAAHGAGPPVICLHGIGGGIASFASQMTALPHHQVIAWNMPGYGASPPPEAGHSFAGLSDALAGLITALGQTGAHLVGQSIGGMIALDHALRRPDQVRSLTLIGTTPSFGGRDDSFKDAFLKARLAPLEAGKTMAQMATEAAPHLVGPLADDACRRAVAAPMADVPPETWRSILRCLVTFNRRADLENIAVPACLIAGSHDQNAPARTMEKMAAKIPGAAFHLIEGAGHMINQEAPAAVNQILAAFLKEQP